MPETPEFESIARRLLAEVLDPTDPQHPANIDALAEQLRLVWNSRGAADIAKIDLEFIDATLTVKSLDRALRSLDR